MIVLLVVLYGNGVTMVFTLVNKMVSLFLDMAGALANNLLTGIYEGLVAFSLVVNKMVSLFLDMAGTLEKNFMMGISVWMASFSLVVHHMKVTMNLNMNTDLLE